MNEDSMKHGAFGWNELMTTDIEAAKLFYGSLFGWETELAPMEGIKYTVIKVDGDPVGGRTRAIGGDTGWGSHEPPRLLPLLFSSRFIVRPHDPRP